MASDISRIKAVIMQAVQCVSGIVEVPVPSLDAEAIDIATSAGLMEWIGNGLARATPAGIEFATP